jgi:hypothetical protein
VRDRQKLRQDLKSGNQAAAAADRLDLKRDLQELRKDWRDRRADRPFMAPYA